MTSKIDMQDIEKEILSYLYQVFGYTWARANPKKIMFANKHDTKVLKDLAKELLAKLKEVEK